MRGQCLACLSSWIVLLGQHSNASSFDSFGGWFYAPINCISSKYSKSRIIVLLISLPLLMVASILFGRSAF